MNADMFTGPFSHDLMIEVMADQYPALKPNVDYLVGHMINPLTGMQNGDPFFMAWKTNSVQKPDPAAIKEIFQANESKYRASFCRRYRDACLSWSDSKATAPADAPANVQAQATAWQAYRQALRQVPEQTGFPFVIDWPVMPA